MGIVLFGIGCAHAPKVVAPPPATTQAACQQIRDHFKKNHATSDAPADMSAGCHMKIGASERMGDSLDRHLQSQGWSRQPAYSNGLVPSEAVYETPSTRCTVLQLHDASSDDAGVSGGIGIGGGSPMSSGFGFGLGLGASRATRITFKIDCLPKDKGSAL